jgi:hypothetical protein
LTPNPANDALLISVNTSFDRIQVYNTLGQSMATILQLDDTFTLPVSAYQSGVYYIRFEKEGKAWSTRFVKQ